MPLFNVLPVSGEYAPLLFARCPALSDELWQFLFGLQQQWRQKGGTVNNPTTDELLLDEGLTPEDLIESGRELRELLLASMTPEERLSGLSEADILRLWDRNEKIRKQVIARTDPEEWLAGLAPEERLAGLAPEQRLAGLAPEQRLAGLNQEELATLLEQIERHLGQHKS